MGISFERRLTTFCNSYLDSARFSGAIKDHIFKSLGNDKNGGTF
jgi:hypothetical protein